MVKAEVNSRSYPATRSGRVSMERSFSSSSTRVPQPRSRFASRTPSRSSAPQVVSLFGLPCGTMSPCVRCRQPDDHHGHAGGQTQHVGDVVRVGLAVVQMHQGRVGLLAVQVDQPGVAARIGTRGGNAGSVEVVCEHVSRKVVAGNDERRLQTESLVGAIEGRGGRGGGTGGEGRESESGVSGCADVLGGFVRRGRSALRCRRLPDVAFHVAQGEPHLASPMR